MFTFEASCLLQLCRLEYSNNCIGEMDCGDCKVCVCLGGGGEREWRLCLALMDVRVKFEVGEAYCDDLHTVHVSFITYTMLDLCSMKNIAVIDKDPYGCHSKVS